jgi:2-polyprenyl-6-methoxyphenol hydroxylase-like FAD-dependent oxidoreductase
MFLETPEVLVAGAGPVGLFTALALAKREIGVHIVDTGVWACKHSYALALHPQSLALFEEFGLRERMLEDSYPIASIGLYDASGRGTGLQVGTVSDPTSCLAVVRQEVIEEQLEKALNELSVNVSWRHEVARIAPAADNVEVTVQKFERQSMGYAVAHTEWVVAKTTTQEVPYVVGADGYNSLVRRTLNLGFPEVGPAQYYAVFEFKTDASLQNELKLVLGDSTTDVCWPLPDGYCRWSFQLLDYQDEEGERLKDHMLKAGFGYFPTERIKDRSPSTGAGHLPVLEEKHLHKLLAERAPWFKGKVENVTWRTVMRFERRLATSFGAGRLWLAGDAAHLTGPAGILSMNAGFFEGRDLAVALARNLRGDGSPAEFTAYNDKWTAAWRQLQGMTGGFTPQPDADPWVRAHAGQLVTCLPAHGAELAGLAGQLKLTVAP